MKSNFEFHSIVCWIAVLHCVRFILFMAFYDHSQHFHRFSLDLPFGFRTFNRPPCTAEHAFRMDGWMNHSWNLILSQQHPMSTVCINYCYWMNKNSYSKWSMKWKCRDKSLTLPDFAYLIVSGWAKGALVTWYTLPLSPSTSIRTLC